MSFSGTGVTAGAASVATGGMSITVPVTVAPERGSRPSRDITVYQRGRLHRGVPGCFTVRPAPTVTERHAALPAALDASTTSSQSITVTGTDFDTASNGVTLDFGPGITFSNVTATSPTTITATATVAASAPRGFRTVTVTNSLPANGASGSLADGYAVGDALPRRC